MIALLGVGFPEVYSSLMWLLYCRHAGLVNVCGVAMDSSLDSRPHGSVVDMDHWGSVRNTLLTEMGRYGTFQRLVNDLTQMSDQQQSALRYYRLHFLGNSSDKAVKDDKHDSLAEYLTALGVLYPDPVQAKTFTIASPLMDSFIRQMVIPCAFPNAPNTPPRRPNRTLDILSIIRSTLRLFDKDFVDHATSSSFKLAPVNVNGRRSNPVPRESVYDSEMTRICKNWLASSHGYQVIGQYHIGNRFCDIVIRYDVQRAAALELVATETAQQIQSHVTRTVGYKQDLNATEGWVIHFTRQDNYLQDAYWPAEADFDQGEAVFVGVQPVNNVSTSLDIILGRKTSQLILHLAISSVSPDT